MPKHPPCTPALQSISDLTPDPSNANRGTPRGRHALTHSLKEFGAARSIVADRLVVVQRTDLDLSKDPRARRLAIADNRTSELDLEWDLDQLAADRLSGLDLGEFWTEAELERLLGPTLGDGQTEPDAVLAPGSTTIQPGDLFVLGRHRLLCGDATAPEAVARLFDRRTPVLMVTDPPYGVEYDPAWRVGVNGRSQTAVGRVANDDRADWQDAWRLFPGDVAYVWHAGLFAAEVAHSLTAAGFDLRSQIIWAKQHFALSRGDYHWQHEPCWYAVRHGATSHWTGDRTQSTVWQVPNLNPFGQTGPSDEDARTAHSTQKPVRLFEMPILNHTTSADAVYDPFCGSGSSLIAAERTGRTCLAMELDRRYVQVIIDRWEQYTQQRAAQVRGGGCE